MAGFLLECVAGFVGIRILTAEETDRLIASLGEDENRAAAQAIMLLLLTGARRNEITRAKWENVDWTQLCCEYLSRNRASQGRSP